MGHFDEFDGWVEDDEVSSPPEKTAGHRIPQAARIRGGKHGKGRKKKVDPNVARARARKAAQARWKK